MTAMSQYWANETLDHALSNLDAPSISAIYVALFTIDNGLDTGVITGEVANLYDYARKAVTFNGASAGATTNSVAVTFSTANGGNWGIITHAALIDSITHAAGNVIYHGALQVDKTINDGDTFKFNIDDITASQ